MEKHNYRVPRGTATTTNLPGRLTSTEQMGELLLSAGPIITAEYVGDGETDLVYPDSSIVSPSVGQHCNGTARENV